MNAVIQKLKCPAIESSEFLCDRVAVYQIGGTIWCHIHARRIQEKTENEGYIA